MFVEEAFRTLKGDLGLRPIYHHKAERTDAHLFVTSLAYCLSITLRQRLKALAGGLMPRVVFEKLATLQLLDVRVPTTDGRELLRVRRTATRNLLSGNRETRYSFDSWLLGLLIKTGRQGLVGFVNQPDKPGSFKVRDRRDACPTTWIRLKTARQNPEPA